MDINNLPEVMVDQGGREYNYIVAVISDQNGAQKTVIRADETSKLHADIMSKLKEEVKEVSPPIASIMCTSRGRIYIELNTQRIEVGSDTGSYGREPNRQQTAAILQFAFPGFKVTVIS